MDNTMRISEIYEEILISIGLAKKTGRDLHIDFNRETKLKELRTAYRFFVDHILERPFSDFKQGTQIALVPLNEAPIIKMLLFCIVSDRPEDKLIAKWLKGKLNCYKAKDYPEIWVLRSHLQARLDELYKEEIIDSDMYYLWKKGFDQLLNFDSVSAMIWIQQTLNELIDSSRPLHGNLDYSDIFSIDFDPLKLSNLQMELTARFTKEIIPLIHTQSSYLYILKLIVQEFTNQAKQQSIKVLEYAGEKVYIRHEELPDTSDKTDSLLVEMVNWEALLNTSMEYNSALRPDLCASTILGSHARKIADREYKEIEIESHLRKSNYKKKK